MKTRILTLVLSTFSLFVFGQSIQSLQQLQIEERIFVQEPTELEFTKDLVDERGPGYFGEYIDINKTANISLPGYSLDNSQKAVKYEFLSNGAKTLNFILKDVYLGPGVELITINPDNPSEQLRYNQSQVSKQNKLVTFPMTGEKQWIVLVGDQLDQVHFEIEKGVYGRKSGMGFGSSGSCNINANCEDANGYRDQQKGVVQILVGGNGWCSGMMVNTPLYNCEPYVLTAAHCMPVNLDNVANWGFAFGYESPGCASENVTPTVYTGAEVKTFDSFYDASLLLMDVQPDPPGGVYYSGWNISQDPPSSGRVFHHPSGDIKKFSVDNSNIELDFWDNDPTEHPAWKVFWDKGTTEGASSGSALLNEAGQIVGTLAGGKASCNRLDGEDFFGRIADVFDYDVTDRSFSYAPFFDPGHTRISEIGGWSCDMTKPNIDLAIANVDGIPTEVCNRPINPVVSVYNSGANTVSNYTLRISDFFEGTIFEQTYTDPIQSGETKVISVGEIVITGSLNLEVEVISNDGDDLRPINDKGIYPIDFVEGVEYVLELKLDSFPGENAVSLKNDLGITIDSLTFGDESKVATLTFPFCLVPGNCYTFTVYDSYGDGLCCDYGEGYYILRDADNQIVAEGWDTPPTPQQAQKEQHDFCATQVSINENDKDLLLKVYPNPVASGSNLKVELPETGKSYEYRIVSITGQTVQAGIVDQAEIKLNSNIANGAYILELNSDANQLRAQFLVR